MIVHKKTGKPKLRETGPTQKRGTSVDEDVRTRLLNVATELFAQKGYIQTSVRELAEAAAVNIAAVNYHFGSKDELYRECLRSCIAPAANMRERMQSHLQAARQGKTQKAGEEALCACVKIFLEGLMSPGSKHSRLIMREQLTGSPQFEQVVREFFLPIGNIFRELLLMLAPDLPQMKVFMVISGIIGQCLHTYNARTAYRVLAGIDSHSPEYIEMISQHIAHFVALGLRGLQREQQAR